MLKNLSFLTLAGALAFAFSMSACIVLTDDGSTAGDTGTAGDGDGDQTGDGDGDATTGDGDGDQTGDGDGDQTGDGDGDQTGDGDGDPAGGCGWDAEQTFPGYYCGGSGEDPDGMFPLTCPDGLVEGDPCGEVISGVGCCDANGDNWYCGEGDIITLIPCGG
jgi:hypothetical protein